MITEQLRLNLIPNGIPPVIHVSQYDVGRTLQFIIYNGSSQYVFTSGESAILLGTKPDGHIFIYDLTISNNVLSIDTTEQMLAIPGNVKAEIRVQGADKDIGTANFIFAVEESPIYKDIIYSDSEIPAIEQAAANIGQAKDAASQAKAYSNGAQTAATNAVASASSASTSATNAAASEANASNSAAAAAISEANAFSGTPEGYAELASTFNALGLYVDSDGYICQALFGETKD